MKTRRYRIEGTTPLIMHNIRLANPLDPIVRRMAPLTAKRKKTPEDHRDIAVLEFQGGLYWDAEAGPYVPGRILHATLVEAAKKQRLGKTVEESLQVLEEVCRLEYEGPRHWEELLKATAKDGTMLYADGRNMTVGSSKVWRTRPMFRPPWSVEFTVEFMENALDPAVLDGIVEYAGLVTGMMDDRPRGGRFTRTVLE